MSTKFSASTSPNGDVLTLLVMDEIGPEWLGMVSSKAVAQALASFKGSRINIRINSPGGDVFEAVAIYNLLADHPAFKHVYIDGLAASGASLISCIGDKVTMAGSATIMVHRAWALVAGNQNELRKMADTLEQ